MSVSSTSSTAVNNIYSSIAAKNKGLGGLVSGLDTESLVEALTLSTRSKIAKQQQSRQLLVWKQSAYRSCVDVLSDFQEKYFTSTKDIRDRMTRRDWYNIYKASSSDDSVIKSNSTSSSMPGTLEIEKVLQKATYATAKSDVVDSRLLSKVGTDFLSQDYDGQTLTLYLDNNASSTYTIDLSSLNDVVNGTIGAPPADYPDLDAQRKDFRQTLENLITEQVGRKMTSDGLSEIPIIVAEIDWSTGVLELKSDLNKVTVTNDVDELGLSQGFTNRIDRSDRVCDIFPNLTGAGYKSEDLIFTINGQTITAKTTESLSNILTRINNTVDAKVKISFDDVTKTFQIISTQPGANVDLTFGDVQGNLLNQMFGTAGGTQFMTESKTANTMNYQLQTDFSDTNFTAAQLETLLNTLDGTPGTLKLTINGVTKEITIGDGMDMAEILENVQDSLRTAAMKDDAVKADVDAHMESYVTGTLEPHMDTFMDAWVVAKGYASGTARDDLSAEDKKLYDAAYKEEYDLSYKATYNNYIDANHMAAYLATSEGEAYQKELLGNEMVKLVNASIKKEFGDLGVGLAYDTATGKFAFGMSGTNRDLYFEVEAGSSGTDMFALLGFTTVAAANGDMLTNYKSSAATTLDDLGVESFGDIYIGTSSTPITVTGSTTLHDLQQQLADAGVTLTVKGGVITMDTNGQALRDESGTNGFLNKVMGIPLDHNFEASFTPGAATNTVADVVTGGVNAQIVVNGQVMVSESNDFSINGINFTVQDVYDGTDGPIVITVEVDSTDLIDKLQQWVDDYNTMYALLNGYTTEQKAKDDNGNASYLPLTDEQKAEMTEAQIKDWEEKAKQGLLQNDPTLRRLCEQMRATIYNTVYDVGLAPYEIGITTVSLYNKANESVSASQSGMLQLDHDKLKTALETNGELVISMFTSETKGPDGEPCGLAHQLNAIIDSAVNTSSVQDPPGSGIFTVRGTLIQLSGTGSLNTGNNTSIIGNRIDAIDKQISKLKLRLEMEYNRYWKQFSSLETAIAKMSAQSSWLTENA